MNNTIQMTITMVLYIAVVIGIGVYFAKRANKSSEDFFIGGRSLGPWVAAMSAEASDMSGWLLMGLPGVAYFYGVSDAIWTAIGLAVGTYLNWLLVAKRLRKYSYAAGNAITIPDFFSNRFKEKNKIILTISSLIILVFFSVYAGSCFATCGKLFSTIFNANYTAMLILGAVFIIIYTFLGGFLAESVSDFMQAVIMIFALVVVLITSTAAAGGLNAVIANIKEIPGFLDFFGMGNPVLGADGVQLVENGKPVFGAPSDYGFLKIISTLSWGLGYFGVPQVLLRFIAIRKSEEIKISRRVATIWVLISLVSAVAIGLIGRSLYPAESLLLSKSGAESIFIHAASMLLHPLFAGLVMAGILAATISSSDSYLLIAASAFSKNIYQGIMKKEATDKQVMNMSRISLIVIAVFGVLIALDKDSIIFNIVSFAWAGFGAAFGPIMLFSLFWKRTTRWGAVAGMLSGGIFVFLWAFLLKPKGGIFGIYELLPAFIVSCIFIVVVSLIDKKPSEEIEKEFELAKTIDC